MTKAAALPSILSKIAKMAETEGFEPSIPLSGYAHLANECLQPLGHVSGTHYSPSMRVWRNITRRLDMPDARAGRKPRDTLEPLLDRPQLKRGFTAQHFVIVAPEDAPIREA